MANRKLKLLLVIFAIASFVPLLFDMQFSIYDNNLANVANDPYGERTLFPEAIADELVYVDHYFKSRATAGDATRNDGSFSIIESYVDMDSCEFCTRVQYTPGDKKAAGFSYFDEKGFDLTNAKRVTFYAMAPYGDAEIKFMVGGKNSPTPSDKELFTDQKFAKSTKYLKLDNNWRFIEIDVSKEDLKNITHPFAFEIKPGKDSERIVFYIKSVYIDTQTAINPITTE